MSLWKLFFSKRFPARILINSNWPMAFAKKSKIGNWRLFSQAIPKSGIFLEKVSFLLETVSLKWKSLAFCWTKTAFYWNDLVFVGNWVGMHRAIRFFWDLLNSKANPMGFQCFPIQIHPISSLKNCFQRGKGLKGPTKNCQIEETTRKESYRKNARIT